MPHVRFGNKGGPTLFALSLPLRNLEIYGTRGSIVVQALLQAEKSSVRDLVRHLNFINFYLILPAALDPGVYSASNRNDYQTAGLPDYRK
jgi:hypothetical protein